ncbi:hypothetical protein AYI70_g1607, partial [Smittium culicis]
MDLSNISSFFEKSKSWLNFGRKIPIKVADDINSVKNSTQNELLFTVKQNHKSKLNPVKASGSHNNLIYANYPEPSREKYINKPPYPDSEYSVNLNNGCFGFLKLKASSQNETLSIASCSKYNSKQRYPENKDYIYYPTEYSKLYAKRDQTTSY